VKQVQYNYFFTGFLKILTFDLSTARWFEGIFLVITLPAPIVEFFPMVIGATKDEFEPTKTLFFITVMFFFLPS
jgi:hypothetical protein